MKKFKKLLIIILLLIPFIVLAENKDVEIKSIELVDKSEDVEELEKATFKDLKLNFSLKFTTKDDYAKYKIVLVNNSDKDYEIDNTSTFNEKKFIKYDYEVDNKDKILKSKDELTVNVIITYIKELEDSDFVDGFYKETNSVSLELVNDNEVIDNPAIKMVTNPNTSTGYILLVIFAVILSMLVLILIKNKKSKLFIITILLTIPLTVFALEKIKIDVETYIEIEKRSYFTLINQCPSEDEEENNWDKEVYEFKEGMSFNDYMNSDYFNSLDINKKNRLVNSVNAPNVHNSLNYYNINLENCLNQIEYPKLKKNMTPKEEEEYYRQLNLADEMSETCTIEKGPIIESIFANDSISNNKIGVYHTLAYCQSAK